MILRTVKGDLAVDPSQAMQVLAQEQLAIQLGRGELVIWDFHLSAPTCSTAVIGCSSERVFCAVLSGRLNLKADGQVLAQAKAGQVIFWSVSDKHSPGLVVEYSGRDMERMLRGGGQPDLGEPARKLSREQSLRRFFGLLRPAPISPLRTTSNSLDLPRKQYLLEPEVVRVRQKDPAQPKNLPLNTAKAMTDNLGNRNALNVAQLLSPLLFVESAKKRTFRGDRQRVAQDLLRQIGNPNTISDPVPVGNTGTNTQFQFDIDTKKYLMTVERFDQMAYVTSIRALEERPK